MKRDIVPPSLCSYITTEFHYAKRNSRLSAYGGVMLQRVCIEKKVNRHYIRIYRNFAVGNHLRRCTGLSSLLLLFLLKLTVNSY